MDRRRILLVVAVLVAALGAVTRLPLRQGRRHPRRGAVRHRRGAQGVTPSSSRARRSRTPQAAGKLALAAGAARTRCCSTATRPPTRRSTGTVALTTIYPGEQIISGKFGGRRPSAVGAADPGGRHGDLGQPDRPGPRRRLRQPRLRGGGLPDRHRPRPAASRSPGCCSTGSPCSASARPRRPRRRPRPRTGAATTEQLPRTLLTLSLDQAQTPRRCCFAAGQRRAGVRSADRRTARSAPDPGLTSAEPLQVRPRCPSSLTPTRWSSRPCWRPCRPGAHGVDVRRPLNAWLQQPLDEYVVVLGPDADR